MRKRDTDYIVKDGKVVIIDEFTGRMMDGRRWSNGLHQAVEAKEGVQIEPENQTMASITFQNYFRMYPKLSGMTGTAETEAAEFFEIYKMNVVTIPTNKPIFSGLMRMTSSTRTRWTNSPPLRQTLRSIAKRDNRFLSVRFPSKIRACLSDFLKKEGVEHNVLNARFHEQEAHIVAQAGQPGAVTIATNMAGRGTDIQLGGNIDFRIEDELGEMEDGPDKDKAIAKIDRRGPGAA